MNRCMGGKMAIYKITYWAKNSEGINALYTTVYAPNKELAEKEREKAKRKGATKIRVRRLNG